jgi:hypothetical protein
VSRAGGLLGAVVGTGAAAVFALIACGGSSEGTVVAKTQPVYDYACQAGGTVTGLGGARVGGVLRAQVLAAGRPRQRRQHN